MMIAMTPRFNTPLFCEIWQSTEEFMSDYSECPLKDAIDEEHQRILFCMLFAKYGEDPIASQNIDQFKYKVFSIIYQYGPTWQRKLEIQERLRGLNEEDIRLGTKTIFNHAYNPSTEPSTATMDELMTVNEQTANKTKSGLPEAYANLWDMLDANVSTYFLNKFRKCFKTFVLDENPLLYYEEDEGREEL